MRALLLLIIAIAVLVLVGWITFNVTSNRASINVETEKVERDTEGIVEAGRELLDETGDAIDRVTDDDPTVNGDLEDVENDAITIDVDKEAETLDPVNSAETPGEIER